MLRGLILVLLISFTSAFTFVRRQCPRARTGYDVTPYVTGRTSNVANFSPTVLNAAGSSVIERQKATETTKKSSRTGRGAWEVRIYNDGMNTREHVARCLVQVTGLSEIAAYQTMMQAHQNGIAVVGRWYHEQAEMYFEALKKNGIVCDLIPVEEDKK
mmetsp:Transcript_7973/g.10196  ORF Transcript_7973/g.10196 Transcript_7973/m.10196 type:complete len:158 (-) Transcript_7973:414-887(-)|eukprot:CAMPEP_0116057586 /NCGR_PEP_ID=MMETSP0322-20121206/4698_1 /TAXON_ID=163516 /ORGANISM="Leptocylindrus danicus var. apora, Strain B651" /LENGTH=157 /DNA_ID=CAMNT_0003541623 /DNA_START=146 /DNA_END=619 /DNA_ORIENTATION=+